MQHGGRLEDFLNGLLNNLDHELGLLSAIFTKHLYYTVVHHVHYPCSILAAEGSGDHKALRTQPQSCSRPLVCLRLDVRLFLCLLSLRRLYPFSKWLMPIVHDQHEYFCPVHPQTTGSVFPSAWGFGFAAGVVERHVLPRCDVARFPGQIVV